MCQVYDNMINYLRDLAKAAISLSPPQWNISSIEQKQWRMNFCNIKLYMITEHTNVQQARIQKNFPGEGGSNLK